MSISNSFAEFPNNETHADLLRRPFNKVQILLLLIFFYCLNNFLISNWTELLYLFDYESVISPSYEMTGPYNPHLELKASFLAVMGIAFFFLEIDFTSYKTLFRQYTISEKGIHRLSNDDVFENENRQIIISLIDLNPGIHYNKLRKHSGLQPGQLQWHLSVLIQYGVIRKKKMGRYVIYFTSFNDQLKSNLSLSLQKSPMTYQILEIIEDNPGINPSQIAKRLNLKRNSVKYHTDKLLVGDLITTMKVGRNIQLYVKKELIESL
ncbi:hypothetical protein NEF87_004212 [Candidatus Lokiarchaeum ossiferum]|uniref:HVO-0163 N-terminal HTH domain-containing protein n=1 Tax=Candidatus Lokiarchaeum ossiferum TaxID=2951803 RepID=A0ABY6HWN7_9ARCH|nr:hypothetical protein NEF87_004212 [Candidatus Lokiarchaeum sp. B-35]